jgi:ElaB/YqjD/DUF883 family membrane-anchored ribosome-binding protein
METTRPNESLNAKADASRIYKNPPSFSEMSLESKAHEVGEKIGNAVSNFANTSSNYLKTGQSYVSHNPSKGVAIAAATGLVLGSLLTLAMRRR